MKINSQTTAFKGATLNINAFSDTHGQLENTGPFFEEIKENEKDLFLKDKKGTKDVIALAGDWYMAGNVTGYKSKPDYNSQRFQLIFFNKLIKELKTFSKNALSIFTPGNHDFDAGFEEFKNCAQKMDSEIVATNIDYENSDDFIKHRLFKSYTVEIPDDKNPALVHKALFLGVLPANMSYYNKQLTGIKFLDNVFKPQSKISPDDIQNTLKALKDEIDKFKKQNPKGAVILLDHFGGNFQKEILAQKLPVNVILSAHEHMDFEKTINGTSIFMLYQNFKKFENVKVRFSDDGDIEYIQSKAYYPKEIKCENVMESFFERVFKKDLQTHFEIPASGNIKELALKGIRYENSPLANYITDVILNRIRKKYPDTDFFALNASAIRGSLKTENSGSINNINLLLTLNGIKEEDADIFISRLSGEELLDIIIENLIANEKDNTKNPLTHFSNLKIQKDLLLKGYKAGVPKKDLIKFLTKINTGETLELDKSYNCANVEKFFKKNKNPQITAIFNSQNTKKTPLNAKDEFRKHFFESIDEVKASNEIRIY